MKAKRSLGQNFFINSNLGDYIINTVKQEESSSVVEIGPGTGFFTQRLIQNFKDITVVEKDTQLANTLKSQYPNIQVINEDFLSLDLEIFNKDCIYFGSLPYNVSKPIVRRIIESENFNKKSFFIVQKEVAEKYIYKEPYSTLSLTTNIYAKTKKILDISPDSFRPRPNVNSSLISFIPIEREIKEKKRLEELISLSFKQPRKNLYNNLKGSKYANGCIPFKTYRPAQLDLDTYIEILNHSL